MKEQKNSQKKESETKKHPVEDKDNALYNIEKDSLVRTFWFKYIA